MTRVSEVHKLSPPRRPGRLLRTRQPGFAKATPRYFYATRLLARPPFCDVAPGDPGEMVNSPGDVLFFKSPPGDIGSVKWWVTGSPLPPPPGAGSNPWSTVPSPKFAIVARCCSFSLLELNVRSKRVFTPGDSCL